VEKINPNDTIDVILQQVNEIANMHDS